MKVAIASDHAGVALKSELVDFLKKKKIEVLDLGPDDASVSVDYPDYAKKLVEAIIAKNAEKGVLICGTGIGISIAANRYKQIRAALCHNEETAKLAREHNDANVLALGARIIDPEIAKKCVDTFLTTSFAGGRHENRVAKL